MKTKRLKIMKKHTLPLVCIPVAALTLAGCSLFGMGETQPATQQTSESTKETQTEITETKETKETQTTEETRTTKAEAEAEKTQTKLSLIAVGDNLIHDTVYEKFEEAPGEYDFTPMYSHIKDLVQSHDIAVINQETIFVENDSEIGSYPDFGTPHEMGDALVDTGFDVVLSAGEGAIVVFFVRDGKLVGRESYDIQTGASQGFLLKQRYGQALFGRRNRQTVSPGAAAHYQYIKFLHTAS